MRNRVSLAAGLLLLFLAAAALGPSPASAMPISAPALKDAAGTIDPTDTVGCRFIRRCGYYGCDWRRVCWAPEPYWRPRYSHYDRPYYRPYYRPPVYYRDYGPPPPHFYRPYASYRPYIPPPWVSGPYLVLRFYYY